ncbi:MAG: hypothetical protein JW990_07135 [Thermoleophilia bacterium]|nr:hypothetical protein [Thermoleophilia bacterium]
MRPLKIVLLILGVVLALAGALSVASGAFVLSLDSRYSDASGFFTTPTQTIGSNGFALTVPDINGQLAGEWQRWGLSHARATVRVTGSSKLPGAVFVGIGPTAQVSKYVAGIARDRVTSIDLRAGSVEYDHEDGTALPAPPDEQDFWAAKAAGNGRQTLEWTLQEGDWAVVIMNADGSAPVAVDMRLGARFGVIKPLIIGLLVGGVVVLAGGLTLIVVGARRRPRGGRAM